jgi:hypothetical protein
MQQGLHAPHFRSIYSITMPPVDIFLPAWRAPFLTLNCSKQTSKEVIAYLNGAFVNYDQ